jgi:hypothetical protein
MKALAAPLAIVIALTSQAVAWGGEGHRLVAEIAERYLEPETARRVRELLALENATTLAEVSTWADEIRSQWRETAPWHYVNIPIHPSAGTPSGYDAARDCPRGSAQSPRSTSSPRCCVTRRSRCATGSRRSSSSCTSSPTSTSRSMPQTMTTAAAMTSA